jgi:hypothetical protein
MAWSSIFASYLAEFRKKFNISLWCNFQCVVNIPLAIFLRMDLGTSGIIMANNINMLYQFYYFPANKQNNK